MRAERVDSHIPSIAGMASDAVGAAIPTGWYACDCDIQHTSSQKVAVRMRELAVAHGRLLWHQSTTLSTLPASLALLT